MLVFILILLLIAAVFGILGAVLKAALVLILAAILAITVVIALGWWAVKRQTRRVIEQIDQQAASRQPRQVYDAEGHVRRRDLPEGQPPE